jgi:hypothetical protein
MLPQNEQLRLASLLIQQAQSRIPTDEERRAAFRRVRGKFKKILMSTEEFQAEKRRELQDRPPLQTSGKLDS